MDIDSLMLSQYASTSHAANDLLMANGHFIISALFLAAQFLVIKVAPALWKKQVAAQKQIIDLERANTKHERDAEIASVKSDMALLKSDTNNKIENLAKAFERNTLAMECLTDKIDSVIMSGLGK